MKQKMRKFFPFFFSGKKILFSLCFCFLFFHASFCSGQGKNVKGDSVLEKLPSEFAGFHKTQIWKDETGGDCLLYQAPSGLCFQVRSTPGGGKILSDDPAVPENKKKMEELFRYRLAVASKSPPEKNLNIKTIFSKNFSVPGLAGKYLRGEWRQYVFASGGKNVFRADHFIAFYRGNVLQVEFLCTDDFMPPHDREKFFVSLLHTIGADLYDGEKVSVPESLKKLLSAAYEKLLSNPLDAMNEAYALGSFARQSRWVSVNIQENDFVWYKSLAQGNEKEKKYAFLLLTSYMAGNAMEQVKEGICADKREAGIKAFKKVYISIREKDNAFSIPELEK